jgi:hypothetical protein
VNRLISGPEPVGGADEDGVVVSDDAPTPFSPTTRASFTGTFAAPAEAQRGAWQAVAAGGRASPSRPRATG